jgi:hypothetical protein
MILDSGGQDLLEENRTAWKQMSLAITPKEP